MECVLADVDLFDTCAQKLREKMTAEIEVSTVPLQTLPKEKGVRLLKIHPSFPRTIRIVLVLVTPDHIAPQNVPSRQQAHLL